MAEPARPWRDGAVSFPSQPLAVARKARTASRARSTSVLAYPAGYRAHSAEQYHLIGDRRQPPHPKRTQSAPKPRPKTRQNYGRTTAAGAALASGRVRSFLACSAGYASCVLRPGAFRQLANPGGLGRALISVKRKLLGLISHCQPLTDSYLEHCSRCLSPAWVN